MSDLRSVRAGGPTDLLALVPQLLGFHPDESVVVLTVGDAPQPFHARVDLQGAHAGELADHLSGVAVRGGVTRMAVVVYSRDPVAARVAGGTLADRLMADGVEPVCLVRADGTHWWPLEAEPGAAGTAYDLSCHPLTAEGVLEGAVVLSSRQELAESLVGDGCEAAEVSALGDAVVARLAHAVADGGARAAPHVLGTEARWVRRRVRRFLEDGRRLDLPDLARLLVVMRLSLEVRDVAWAEMSHANAARHVDLWRDVVRRAPVRVRAAPAALLGFAAWLSGNGALAWCAVDCAQDADPGYGLAGLLTQALTGAVPPSVWRPFPPAALTVLDD
jgi:Domain of unknown function (DUF4192)